MAHEEHEFTIHAADLDAGGREFRFVVGAAWIRGALEDSEATAAGPDGELTVRASKSGNDVVVSGRLRAELEAPCARCLQPAAVHVDQPLNVLVVPEKKLKTPKEAEHDVTEEEADTVHYDGETVVLDSVVRDELVLEMPMIPLCREDCPGMSPSARGGEAEGPAAKPLDPRLAPLLRLKNLKKELLSRGGPQATNQPFQAQHAPREPRQGHRSAARPVRQLRRAVGPAPRLPVLWSLQGQAGRAR